jgi:hypothetical protein
MSGQQRTAGKKENISRLKKAKRKNCMGKENRRGKVMSQQEKTRNNGTKGRKQVLI